jgi:hypothetical protein
MKSTETHLVSEDSDSPDLGNHFNTFLFWKKLTNFHYHLLKEEDGGNYHNEKDVHVVVYSFGF